MELSFNYNGMSSSPESDQWFEEMFARRKLTSDYDEELIADDDVDECVEDLSFNDKDLY